MFEIFDLSFYVQKYSKYLYFNLNIGKTFQQSAEGLINCGSFAKLWFVRGFV